MRTECRRDSLDLRARSRFIAVSCLS
jgi:hypothetical protein